jgi:hypothetical protein
MLDSSFNRAFDASLVVDTYIFPGTFVHIAFVGGDANVRNDLMYYYDMSAKETSGYMLHCFKR